MIERLYIANPTTPLQISNNLLIKVLERAILSGDISSEEAEEVMAQCNNDAPSDSIASQLGETAMPEDVVEKATLLTYQLEAEKLLMRPQPIE